MNNVDYFGRVIKDEFYLENIKWPSYSLQLASVIAHPTSIRYIKKPKEELMLIAVCKNPNAIWNIENPTEKVCMEAVRRDPRVIRFISNPSDKVKELALYLDIDTWQFINLENKYTNKINSFPSMEVIDCYEYLCLVNDVKINRKK